LLSTGESIAVQNFNENFCVLSMLGIYSFLLAIEIPIQTLINLLGMVIAFFMLKLLHQHRNNFQKTEN
jgi:MFS transporter, LPLT family, lysophospholipid transporter